MPTSCTERNDHGVAMSLAFRPLGDASSGDAAAGRAEVVRSEFFTVHRSCFTPPSCAAAGSGVRVHCEALRCTGSGALFVHAASAPQAEMVRARAAARRGRDPRRRRRVYACARGNAPRTRWTCGRALRSRWWSVG